LGDGLYDLVRAIHHAYAHVVNGTERVTGGNTTVGGMLDVKDARSLVRAAIRWGSGGSAVDSALVETEHEAECGVMLHKGGQGCGNSWPGSYEVCVIGVSDQVHCTVRSRGGLKRVLKHQC
jgi:hypothetical protein